MDPKWIRFGAKIALKTCPKINANRCANINHIGFQNEKVGGRGVARCGGGRGGGKPPPDLSEVGFER